MAGVFELDLHYRSMEDPRVFVTESGVYPAVFAAGSNPNLLQQIGNYVPLR
jgi:hypothetical protein